MSAETDILRRLSALEARRAEVELPWQLIYEGENPVDRLTPEARKAFADRGACLILLPVGRSGAAGSYVDPYSGETRTYAVDPRIADHRRFFEPST